MKITNRQGNTCLFSFALDRGILKVEKHAGRTLTEPARHALKERIFGACPTALPGSISPKAENAGHSAALPVGLGGTSAACATNPTALPGSISPKAENAGHSAALPMGLGGTSAACATSPTALPGNVSPKAENAGHSAALPMGLGGTSAACATSPTAGG